MNYEILLNQKVINKKGEIGLIIQIEDGLMKVAFDNRDALFQTDAFLKGFLKYMDPDLQEKVDQEILNVRKKEEEAECTEELKRLRLVEKRQLEAEASAKARREYALHWKDAITSFKDEYRFLSNFYPCEFEFDGVTYHSSEAAFQAQKASTKIRKRAYGEITNPVTAKRMGKKEIIDVELWNEQSYGIMKKVLRQKFSIPELKEKLLATGDRYLLEGNSHHDNIWGRCDCPKCMMKEFKNKLGYALMEVREELSKS